MSVMLAALSTRIRSLQGYIVDSQPTIPPFIGRLYTASSSKVLDIQRIQVQTRLVQVIIANKLSSQVSKLAYSVLLHRPSHVYIHIYTSSAAETTIATRHRCT